MLQIKGFSVSVWKPKLSSEAICVANQGILCVCVEAGAVERGDCVAKGRRCGGDIMATPYHVNMNSDQALHLVKVGASLLFLNVPASTSFGIDLQVISPALFVALFGYML